MPAFRTQAPLACGAQQADRPRSPHTLPRYSWLPLALLIATAPCRAVGQLRGTYSGTATYRGQQVPLTLILSGSEAAPSAALVNGPSAGATGLDRSKASSVTVDGKHLVISFNYFNHTLDLTAGADGHLSGTFGDPPAEAPSRVPVDLQKGAPAAAKPGGPSVVGAWEIAVHSAKGERAWQMQIAPTGHAGEIRAVIQRVDGDTGSLFGRWNGSGYVVGHFNAEGPDLYAIAPVSPSELRISHLVASDANRPWQTDLTALRPGEARRQNLPGPTLTTEQTSMKDPGAPLHFSGKTLDGKTVTQSDPDLHGKVVIVTIGGSWCPNCHDEAPFLESLYKQYRDKGLEIIDLSFEDGDQFTNPSRLRAFVARYGLTYPVLLAGHRDDLNRVIPGVNNLNAWPTSFFLGRDGKVKEIHAGFAGPANPAGNAEVRRQITALVQRLLQQR